MTGSRIQHVDALSSVQADAVRQIVSSAAVRFGGELANPPINERALLHLRSGAPFEHSLMLGVDGSVLGYGQLERADDHVGAELVTDVDQPPTLADALLADLEQRAGSAAFLLWAHGTDSAAGHAATAAGYHVARSLLQMRRSLPDLEVPALTPPDGVTVRAFEPGRDDAAWLAVNARAFAHHPEQGSWTQADLEDRLTATWFDPAGFLLAERGTELLGYHWTKVHDETAEPVGEVYVLGVDPAAQGLRLGSLLLNAGLAYLKARGLATVLLYSDESNTTAVRLYETRGFAVVATDVQYARP